MSEDSKEIKELIKQGYLPTDYKHEDIFKLCNPKIDEEEAALKKAPEYFWTCIIAKRKFNYLVIGCYNIYRIWI